MTEAVDVVVTDQGMTIGRRGHEDGTTLNGHGLILAPGYIDTQVNGGFGDDFTVDPQSIWAVGSRLIEHGVTGFMPTIITSPPEAVTAALATLRAGPPTGYQGARAIGLHIEGPMISRERRGTHPVEYLRDVDRNLISGWTKAAGVAMVTLAPELPGAPDAITELVDAGVIVSMGHSTATAAEARIGLAAGASHGTHLFNAMAPLHHREPGLAGVLLTDSTVTTGIIIDGIHVAPEMVALAWKAMGRDRLVPITDAMAGMGMPPGEYRIGDVVVTVDATGAHNRDGALAGSTLTMDEAVRNLVRFSGCSLDDAIGAATITPRRVLGVSPSLSDTPDLVLLDKELSVVATIIGGQIVYQSGA